MTAPHPQPEHDRDLQPEHMPDLRPALEQAWQKVDADWDNPEAHRRFVAACHSLGALSFAGGQYRSIAERDGERAAVARRQIDAVVAVAAAEMFSQRSEPMPQPRVLKWVALVFLLGTVLYTAQLLLRVM